ncbi:MAG: hypothetical protein KF760_32420 [Candidatus Eremiobacteraeota bacterium]|nr:hypothetical protein [Candidatus Eremiobacteraeota bacterium]MCW5872514.1 hypothetical protein [Candidatus Eremiobacteraeota bacterium]
MRKLIFLGLCGLISTSWAWAARSLPAPIVIHGSVPTTASLRAELLEEESTPLYLHKQEIKLNYLGKVKFDTVYDPLTRLSTYYDNHLLQDLNRTDNPYGHNRPGIGINF